MQNGDMFLRFEEVGVGSQDARGPDPLSDGILQCRCHPPIWLCLDSAGEDGPGVPWFAEKAHPVWSPGANLVCHPLCSSSANPPRDRRREAGQSTCLVPVVVRLLPALAVGGGIWAGSGWNTPRIRAA